MSISVSNNRIIVDLEYYGDEEITLFRETVLNSDAIIFRECVRGHGLAEWFNAYAHGYIQYETYDIVIGNTSHSIHLLSLIIIQQLVPFINGQSTTINSWPEF